MTRVLKIFKYLSLTIGLLVVLLITLSFVFQDKVTRFVLNELNKSINTTVSIGKIRLSLLKNFPKASLEFKDVIIGSPKYFIIPNDSVLDERNLLDAKVISASFRPIDLIRKSYNVEKISINGGSIMILSGGQGE